MVEDGRFPRHKRLNAFSSFIEYLYKYHQSQHIITY